MDFLDVQQGDGAIVETPAGRLILIDGGDNQLFARYLAAHLRGTSADAVKEIDCIVVTHGDADDFTDSRRFRDDLKEAYAFRFEGDRIIPDGVRKT